MSSDLSAAPQLQIVGGAYREYCLHPVWTEVFGSGGRAASAVAAMGVRARLSCYADEGVNEVVSARAALEAFSVRAVQVERSPQFDYVHGLATPTIHGVGKGHAPLDVDGSAVLRFGMLEGDAVVRAVQAVYDPQDPTSPRLFGANGSRAQRLALVLNRQEARLLAGVEGTVGELAAAVQALSAAEAVVVKNGARGAIVLEGGRMEGVPAYQSERVWKIGSGDNFAAHFAVRWMLEGKSAAESADLASRATAYYCETRGFISDEGLRSYSPPQVHPSPRYADGRVPQVYLAGPFFTLAQLWQVNEARNALQAAGVTVFSPYHDVGFGSAAQVVGKDIRGIVDSDVVFAIADGMDPGTVFEIGYARATGTPVVIYCERESDEAHKMFEGTECRMETDFVSAVYRTLWTAYEL